jgi:hypothetical protein
LSNLPRLVPTLAVYAIVAVGYLSAILELTRESNERHSRARTLLLFVGLALLGEVALSFAWPRMFAVCMPGIILFASSLRRTGAARRGLVTAAWLSMGLLALLFVRSTSLHHQTLVNLPADRVATTPLDEDKLPWIVEHTPARVLFAATRPSMYLTLGLRSPLYQDAVVAGQMTRAQVDRMIAELEMYRVPRVLWTPIDDPAVVPLRAYLSEHYVVGRTFADGDELWERRDPSDHATAS